MADLPAGNGKRECVWVHGVAVPAQFPYLSVLLQGRPRHGWDDFAFRHPRMEREKRAKLFAPYDALDGYSAHVKGKNTRYMGKIILDEEEKAELNRRLLILRELTANRRLARAARVRVTVRYYVPCADADSLAYGAQGTYEEARGTVWRVDAERGAITVDSAVIAFDDILSVTAADGRLFGEGQEDADGG